MHVDNIPFWFILDLILFSFAMPVFDLLTKNRTIGLVSIALSMVVAYNYGHWYSPLLFESESIVYYLIGVYIGKYHFDCQIEVSKKKMVIGVFGVIVCILLRTYWDASIDNLIVRTFVLTAYTLSLFFAFDVIMEICKYTELNFATRSFWVFALHANVSAVVTKLLYFVLPKTIVMAWVNLFLTIILTLVIINYVAIAIQRLSPKLYSVLGGGR